MMEWLRALLEKAEVKDGVLDIDKLMSTVNVEAPKNVMSKAEFNNVNEQLKTANSTIESLKKDNKDNADLQAKITEHENTIDSMKKDHKAEIAKMKKESAIKDSLRKEKARHEDLLLGKFNLDKLQLNEDGSILGIDDQLKQLKENYKDMFDTEKDDKADIKGLKTHEKNGDPTPGETSQGSSFAKAMNESGKVTESKFFN